MRLTGGRLEEPQSRRSLNVCGGCSPQTSGSAGRSRHRRGRLGALHALPRLLLAPLDCGARPMRQIRAFRCRTATHNHATGATNNGVDTHSAGAADRHRGPPTAHTYPPFWAQTDSVQIMTWTRQIRLIWALVMPRMHARGGSYGRWMLLGDAGAVSLVSALRQAQEQCASPTGSSPRASPVFSSSSGRRTAVPCTCRLGHPVRTGGG